MRSIVTILYLLLIAYIVFFVGNDYRFYHPFNGFGSLNLIPFKDKINFLQHSEDWGGNNMYFFLKEVFGNLLLLFPFPFILILLYDVPGVKKATIYSLLLSGSIEMLQLVSGMGNADIDDIILNTLGAGLGAVCAYLLQQQKLRRSAKIPIRPS